MPRPDLTYTAVTRQLRGFGVDRFELGLYCEVKDNNLPRTWDKAQIIKSLGWLKKMNIEGRNIFIRPEGSQGLVFFDDLNRGQIDQLNIAGFEPAIIIQSSPYNFHGWIRVANEPIEPELATLIAKKIARDFSGDKDSADWRHFGRLAGFTNQKRKHLQGNGKQPFVMLDSYRGKLCTRAQTLLDYSVKEQERLNKRPVVAHSRVLRDNLTNPDTFYLHELKGLEQRYGTNIDKSRADWMIIKSMLGKGYCDGMISSALANHSPAIDKRKGHAEQYIEITLHNAKTKAFSHE